MKNPRCEITSKKFDLPPQNNMIPKNFDILAENKELSEKPKLIFQDECTDLWYQKDDEFFKPKANIQMKIYTQDNDFGKSIEGRVFANVWKNCLLEYLNEYNYMAEMASLQVGMNVHHDNIDIQWGGYNDSMINFVKETFNNIGKMKNENLAEIFD